MNFQNMMDAIIHNGPIFRVRSRVARWRLNRHKHKVHVLVHRHLFAVTWGFDHDTYSNRTLAIAWGKRFPPLNAYCHPYDYVLKLECYWPPRLKLSKSKAAPR